MGISLAGSTALDQLTQRFFSKFDSNTDGKIDVDEFTNFLGSMLSSIGVAPKTSPAAPAVPATPAAPVVIPSRAGDGVEYSFGDGVSTAEPRRILYRVMEGMDSGKLGDTTHRTVKYLFGRVAQTYDLGSVKSKADAEQMLRSMDTDFKAVGLDVSEYDGDRIKVKLDNGEDAWFDVVRACGSANQAWQFLDTRS